MVEATAGQVARAAGVSTATVVRTAQALGYSGFPQLRVMLARDLGAASPQPTASGPVGVVWNYLQAVADALPEMTSQLDPDALEQAIRSVANARQVLVAGNGVSAPVALDFAMRLTTIGRSATMSMDSLDQVIRARLLSPGDACIVVSGTGATATSLAVARAASTAGATVIALTSFSGTPLTQVADINLVVVMGVARISEELHYHVRLPQSILVNAVIAAVATLRPRAAADARGKAIEVVSEILLEP